LREGRYLNRIREDLRSGVNGTPTFFINGVRHDDSWDLASLITAIEEVAEERRR
jgi:protein-disulfide isomerase